MPFDKIQVQNIIEQWDAAYGKAKSEYDNAQDYFEAEQAPPSSQIPKGRHYFTYNLHTAQVHREVGQAVGGEIGFRVLGGGEMNRPTGALLEDFLDANDFQSTVYHATLIDFFNMGLGGIKFIPPRRGIHPRIIFIPKGQLWLDPTAQDPFHTTDQVRVHAFSIPLELAQSRWPNKAGEIVESLQETSLTEIRYVDIYEVEYRIEDPDTGEDVFYRTKHANKTVQLEPPRPTGYPDFQMVDLIHTPRFSSAYGKYPFGLFKLRHDAYDQLNMVASLILDAVKVAVKQTVYTIGATSQEEEKIRDQISRPDGYINVKSHGAKVDVIRGSPIPPALVELFNFLRFSLDEMADSHKPSRGDLSGSLSGKAINFLQTADAVPDFSHKKSIERGLGKLGNLMLHYVNTDMVQQFNIIRDIKGADKEIPFNTPVPAGYRPPEGDDMMVVKNGFLNALPGLTGEETNSRIKVSVDLNRQATRNQRKQEAAFLRNAGAMSLEDMLREFRPETWEVVLDNLTKENRAMQVVQELMQTSPEAFEAGLAAWNEVKGKMALDGEFSGGGL